MDLKALVRELGRESILVVRSDEDLASSVLQSAKEQAKSNDVYAYGKPPTPVRLTKPLLTSPAQVLHELGVATTLLTASPLAQVARHWAHVRYCGTLTTRKRAGHERQLALARYADDVVYHHKMTQSEQLGIGLALVVAKAVLRTQYPGWEFHVVDAEVALKAGFITDVGDIEQAPGTKKRPDYFLVGRRATGRHTGFKVIVLECKGTHKNAQFAVEQLARASVQVEALRVGGRTPPSLMVASHLARGQITSYLLDPDGAGDLWSGPIDDMDELLRGDPHQQDWRPRLAGPAASAEQATEPSSVEDDADATAAATAETATTESPPPAGPYVYDIPEERRNWFVQVLTRAAAASTLLFAGNSDAARAYATPRQRGDTAAIAEPALFDLDPPWAANTATTLRLPNGLHLEGTRYRTPLPDGKTLEVFRGVERRLYSLLANGRVGPYLRAAPGTYRRWSRAPRPADAALSFGRDGTAVVVRVTNS